MKIIISPAKKMNHNEDLIMWKALPHFLEQTKVLKDYLARLSYEELKALWRCNDKIARQNHERLQNMELHGRLTPAVLAYEGLQYQYMAPHVFASEQWQYVEDNLVILSGFYGLLRATDGITPYRLEMQATINLNNSDEEVKSLYQYWGDSIYRKLIENDDTILNLASKEYSRIIEKYLEPEVKFITCVFGEEVETAAGRKVKVKATQAKMARGEMVRFLSEKGIQTINGVKDFDRLSYKYCEDYSSQSELVFVKKEPL